MSALKDKYQSVGQFFKDVKRTVEDIVTRLSDVETRIDESVGGGALPQEEENGKEYKAGEGILITDDDSIVLDYNGPFAYQLDHIDTTTATTLWVTRSVGYVVRNGLRKTVYANTTPAAMASGESAWMLYNTDADSYSISIQTNAPTATSNKICVKLAENVNGVLRQIQFGEVVVVATGGGGGSVGFPDYAHPIITGGELDFDITYGPYSNPVWLIGLIESETVYESDWEGYADILYLRSEVQISFNSGSSLYLTKCQFPTCFPGQSPLGPFSPYHSNYICLPIPAGNSFELSHDSDWNENIEELAIYPCI